MAAKEKGKAKVKADVAAKEKALQEVKCKAASIIKRADGAAARARMLKRGDDATKAKAKQPNQRPAPSQRPPWQGRAIVVKRKAVPSSAIVATKRPRRTRRYLDTTLARTKAISMSKAASARSARRAFCKLM